MLEEPKKKMLEANLLLPRYGLIVFTWGDVSRIDREHGIVAIRSSGVEYGDMSVKDAVSYGLEGNVAKGKLKPSSDLMIHLEFYKNFPNIEGAVHTRSRWATVSVQIGEAISALRTTQADYSYEDIPCTRQMSEAEIHGEYGLEIGYVTVETFKQEGIDLNSTSGALVCSHGPSSWGKDLFKVVHNAIAMEEYATAAFMSVTLQNGGAQSTQKVLLDKHFRRKHGPNAYRGQGSSS